ncbi:MAG: hypothetical protein R3344_07050, partial [Acidobacteriota bacterium]|nr:hypothetical protein [Acidobacteriota bacterium]
LLASLRRIEANRQGVFMARAEDGSCQLCYVRIRPQAFQEIKLASEVHVCSQCRRFLYFEDALRPATPGQTDSEAGPESVGAADGGTV